MTKGELISLDRIEKILIDIDKRVRDVEINTRGMKVQQETDGREISSLRKKSNIWDGVNSFLIAGTGIIMLILKGS